MGADAVGFVFAPSPRQIAVKRAYDISRRLPPEILTVGVFRDEHPSRVIEMVHDAGLKAAQLHGHESPADVAAVGASVRFVVKAVVAGSTDARHADKFGTGLVLLDAPAPGSGKSSTGPLPVTLRPGHASFSQGVSHPRTSPTRSPRPVRGVSTFRAGWRASRGRRIHVCCAPSSPRRALRPRSRTSVPTRCPTTGRTTSEVVRTKDVIHRKRIAPPMACLRD